MSFKAPKKYGKPVQKQGKTTATKEEEQQAKRVIGGIACGLAVIVAVTLVVYHFVLK